ncbi:hypothetical protein CPLU01_05302 [Colletotrichum plurivorum]|uniref:Uncharacterized protein n=1 Tax=Colletotrichum plurivorum TaxID=2175906 RepID=A0A8H6NHI7_9PEZI|nr:hypothetical protein CPLU01_05302 [Colletotrichum plurivorum]
MPNDAEEMAGFHRSQTPRGTFERYCYRLRQQTRTEGPAEPFNDVADGTSRRPNGRKDGEVKRQRVRRLDQQAANLKAVGYLETDGTEQEQQAGASNANGCSVRRPLQAHPRRRVSSSNSSRSSSKPDGFELGQGRCYRTQIVYRFASLDRAPFALDLDLALRPVTVQQPQNEPKSVHVTYTSPRPCAPVKATALDLGHSCAPPAEQARIRHWTVQPKIRSRHCAVPGQRRTKPADGQCRNHGSDTAPVSSPFASTAAKNMFGMYSPAGVVPLTIRHLSRLPESNHGTRSPTLHPRFADVHAPNRPASVRHQLLRLLDLHCTSRSKSRAWALLLPHQHDAARRHSSDHTTALHGTTRPFSLAAEAAQDTGASSSWVHDNARKNPQPAVHNGGRIDEQDGGGQAGKPGTGRNLQAVLHARTEVVPDLRFVIYRPSDKVTSAFGSTTQTDHPLRKIGLAPGSQKGLSSPNAYDTSSDTRLGPCGCWTGVRGQSLSRTNQEQEEDIINGKEEDSTQT